MQCPKYMNPADYLSMSHRFEISLLMHLVDIVTEENAERISGKAKEEGGELLVTKLVKQYPCIWQKLFVFIDR